MRILGFLRSALAIANLYFYPPDKLTTELDPKNVSSFCSKSKIKFALAFSIASIKSYSEASLFPNNKFSLIVPMIIVGS
jgi:hypothetical protein